MSRDTVKKEVALYNNTVHVLFNNNARNRYLIKETEASPVGVTTILQSLAKPGLALWPMYEALGWLKEHKDDYEGAEKAYLIKSDKGKSVGTVIHDLIERFFGGETIASVIPDANKAWRAFLQWANDTEYKVLATEQIIYSKELDYAGTYDALLEIDGKVVLADIKTTNASRTAPLGLYPEMFLQLGAYSLAHHEENPEQEIDDVMIIRVGKDGTLNTLRASELGFKLAYLEDTFKHLVEVYKMMQPLTKKLGEMK